MRLLELIRECKRYVDTNKLTISEIESKIDRINSLGEEVEFRFKGRYK